MHESKEKSGITPDFHQYARPFFFEFAFEIETPVNRELNARTSGGSIEARLINPIEYIEVSTSGGNVTVEVPENLGYDLELTGSRVRIELRNFTGGSSRDAIKGSVNGGGILLKARTSEGLVSVKYYKVAS